MEVISVDQNWTFDKQREQFRPLSVAKANLIHIIAAIDVVSFIRAAA